MTGLGIEYSLYRGPTGVTDLGSAVRNGTYNGGMGVVANTESGGVSAFDLDGTDDFISTPSIASGTGDWSYGFWTKLDADFNQDFLSNRSLGASGAQPGFVIGHNGTGTVGQLQIQVDSGASAWVNNTYSSVLSTGVWMHFVVTFDNSTAEIKTYKNGVLLTPTSSAPSGTPAGANYSSGNSVIIGGRPGTTARCVNGLMDGVFVVNSVLSAHEVMESYTGGRMYDRPTDPVGLGSEILLLRGPSGVIDQSGNGNNGTYNGGMGVVADTDVGGVSAFELDGINDWISIVNRAAINLAGSFSLSCWVKMRNRPASGKWTMIAGKGGATESSGDNHNYGIIVDNGAFGSGDGITGLYENTSGSNTIARVSDSATGTWRHIGLVHDADANTLTVYIDGVSVAVNSSATATPDPSTVPFTVGRPVASSFAPNHAYLDALLDDIALFDLALSSAEITELYTGQRGYNRPAAPTFNPAWAHNSTQVIA